MGSDSRGKSADGLCVHGCPFYESALAGAQALILGRADRGDWPHGRRGVENVCEKDQQDLMLWVQEGFLLEREEQVVYRGRVPRVPRTHFATIVGAAVHAPDLWQF